MTEPSPPPPDPAAPPLTRRLRRLVEGPARSPLDPKVFHSVSLVAFLAWVGLGADGLSSVCYGPEEAFRALGDYHGLAVLLAAMTAVTVLVISASYTLIIEEFPSGGGAYVVASKLLGPSAGLVAGTALLVDYVLTIAISIASATDAVFSFLPAAWIPHRVAVALAGLILLVLLNLRGVRESTLVMAPVFLLFLVTHVVAVLAAVVPHGIEIGAVVAQAGQEARTGAAALGSFGLAAVLLRAYSLGGGTYTGIEAVSNSLPVLREPRVRTAKRAMVYMAFSLAFMAGGILLAYLLVGVEHVPGKTLNAVLFERTFGGWPAGGLLVLTSLVAEAALLGIAAQTGFVGGPQVLAGMAADQWVPRRFMHLSDRLVTRNGILLFGLAAAVTMVMTGGSVALLVVLYSINVFLTFTLSQLGMVRHWWAAAPSARRRRLKLLINGLGLVLTSFILVVTVAAKFLEGGWVTLVTTGVAFAGFVLIRRHYERVQNLFRRLDETLASLPPIDDVAPGEPDRDRPVAAILVGGYGGLGVHTLLSVFRLFGDHFKGVVFMSVGIVDSSRFKGPSEIDGLRCSVEQALDRYTEVARSQGVPAAGMYQLATDPVAGIEELADEVRRRYPRSVFFAGKLIFQRETFLTRLLHNQTASAVQRRLHPKGYPVVVLPILAE